jgi:hypothetical protein
MDPDPALAFSGSQDASKKSAFLLITLLTVCTFTVFKDNNLLRSNKTVEFKVNNFFSS